jgi:chromosome segregation ATPase
MQSQLELLTNERDAALEEIAEINEDRTALTNAIKELNFKQKRSEKDMDSMLSDISLHEQKVRNAEKKAATAESRADEKV